MEPKKLYVSIGLVVAILLIGGASTFTYLQHQQNQENSLYAKESVADKITGLNGQSTRIDTDKETLAAPSEMKVQGLDGVMIEEKQDDAGVNNNGVTGLSGLKIE